MASLDPIRKPSLDSLAPSDRSSRKSSDYEGSKYDEDDEDDTTTTWSDADADHTRLLRNRPSDDLESQTRRRPATAQLETSSQPVEYSVPTSKKLFYLALYFAFNLGLTLSNKALLGHVSGFVVVGLFHCRWGNPDATTTTMIVMLIERTIRPHFLGYSPFHIPPRHRSDAR